jgi:hypothetical protein
MAEIFEGVIKVFEQEGGYADPAIDLWTDTSWALNLTNELEKYDGKAVRITIEIIGKENE